MLKNRGFLILLVIGGLVVAGAAGWYFLSPLFIDRAVDEELPFVIPDLTAMPAEQVDEIATEIGATAAAMPDKEMDDEMPEGDQPTTLAEGIFVDADSFHQGSGMATIIQLSDGTRFLRFEDFSVTNGPDLHVFIATGVAPTDRNDLGDYVDLGELKGNLGNQNYEIPDNVSLDDYNSVVIYCVPFHVVFSTASL
jgi:hypothetical protein